MGRSPYADNFTFNRDHGALLEVADRTGAFRIGSTRCSQPSEPRVRVPDDRAHRAQRNGVPSKPRARQRSPFLGTVTIQSRAIIAATPTRSIASRMDLCDHACDQCSDDEPGKYIGEKLIELHPPTLFVSHARDIWSAPAAETMLLRDQIWLNSAARALAITGPVTGTAPPPTRFLQTRSFQWRNP
jgi:hypothetical protein